MKSLEPENFDIPLGRSFDVTHAQRYVINSFKLHQVLDRIYRIAETNTEKRDSCGISVFNSVSQCA